jgi:hypothetical protein
MAKKFKYKSNITATLATIWGGLTFFSGISGYILQPDLTIMIITTLVLGTILTIITFFYDLKRIEIYIKLMEVKRLPIPIGTGGKTEDIEIEIECEEEPEAAPEEVPIKELYEEAD